MTKMQQHMSRSHNWGNATRKGKSASLVEANDGVVCSSLVEEVWAEALCLRCRPFFLTQSQVRKRNALKNCLAATSPLCLIQSISL